MESNIVWPGMSGYCYTGYVVVCTCRVSLELSLNSSILMWWLQDWIRRLLLLLPPGRLIGGAFLLRLTALFLVLAIGIGCYGCGGSSGTSVSSFPVLTVTSPYGGESFVDQFSTTVTWTSENASANVNIEISQDGGIKWYSLASNTPNDGSETVSTRNFSGSVCLIRITEADGYGTDYSGVFSIDNPMFAQDSGNFDVSAIKGVRRGSLAFGDYDMDGDLDLAMAGDSGTGFISTIYRNDSGVFVDSGAVLPGVRDCSLAFGDYDRDGDLDLALAGETATGPITRIYRNDSGAFVDSGAVLPGVSGCSLAFGDYDNDGDLDLVLSGASDSGSGTKIYRNNSGIFTDIAAGLPDAVASLAWGDYDNDGDLDLALTRAGSNFGTSEIGEIYRNDSGIFSAIGAGLPGVNGSLAFGDYDNDGDLDIAIAGYSLAGWISRIYRNDSGTFTDIEAGLIGTDYSGLAWGDFDNDGDLDLILSGERPGEEGIGVFRIYRNDSGIFTDMNSGFPDIIGTDIACGDCDGDGDLDVAIVGYFSTNGGFQFWENFTLPNTMPLQPENLNATVSGSGSPYEVTFSWDNATDYETPIGGLSYELRVGTTSGGNEIYSGMHLPDGQRLLTGQGFLHPGTSSLSHRLMLPAGTYYWTVQSIDSGFEGSSVLLENQIRVPLTP
jgi:predicted nucleotidyltransferase